MALSMCHYVWVSYFYRLSVLHRLACESTAPPLRTQSAVSFRRTLMTKSSASSKWVDASYSYISHCDNNIADCRNEDGPTVAVRRGLPSQWGGAHRRSEEGPSTLPLDQYTTISTTGLFTNVFACRNRTTGLRNSCCLRRRSCASLLKRSSSTRNSAMKRPRLLLKEENWTDQSRLPAHLSRPHLPMTRNQTKKRSGMDLWTCWPRGNINWTLLIIETHTV